jgi:malate synthase
MASVDVQGLEIHAPLSGRMEEVLTPDALEFVAGLHREFEPTRQELREGAPRRWHARLPRRDARDP